MSTQTSSNPSPSNAPPLTPPTAASGGSGAGAKVMIGLLVVILLVGGVFGLSRLAGGSAKNTKKVLRHEVKVDEMIITVTEDGNVESASNIDVKCRVSGGSSILSIVEDGKYVKKGDELVTLDSSSIEDKINSQTITFNQAKSSLVEATTAVEVANISVKEYLQGVYKQELQTADANITIYMENLRSAQNSLEHTKKMFRKGFVSVLELESQQFNVKHSQLNLETAKTAKEVLEKFTRAKTLADLNSKVKQAEAKLDSVKAQYELEKNRLAEFKDQLKFCTIKAPQAGMVVYANPRSRWGQQSGQIEEGSTVRERQTIIQLPDLERMQVKVTVHETKVEKLQRGMPARVKIQGKELKGRVISIANQPEAGSWFSGSVKEYATIVKIDGSMEGLKPGMTAEVEILVSHKPKAVTLPVAAVVNKDNSFFCWVEKDGSYEKRNLDLGMTDDKYVEVINGVVEGDVVALNPRAAIDGAKEAEAGGKVDVKKKFGDIAKASNQASSKGSRSKGGKGSQASKGNGSSKGKSKKSRKGKKGRRPTTFAAMLKQYDKDGDKKISKKEATGRLAQYFQWVDANKDGFYDKKEYDAMMKRMRSRGGGKRGGGGGGRGGQ